VIGDTIRMLRLQALTILLVEQNFLLRGHRRRSPLRHGRVIDMIPNAAIEANREKLKTYLGA